jgi:hypothetical protein
VTRIVTVIKQIAIVIVNVLEPVPRMSAVLETAIVIVILNKGRKEK